MWRSHTAAVRLRLTYFWPPLLYVCWTWTSSRFSYFLRLDRDQTFRIDAGDQNKFHFFDTTGSFDPLPVYERSKLQFWRRLVAPPDVRLPWSNMFSIEDHDGSIRCKFQDSSCYVRFIMNFWKWTKSKYWSTVLTIAGEPQMTSGWVWYRWTRKSALGALVAMNTRSVP